MSCITRTNPTKLQAQSTRLVTKLGPVAGRMPTGTRVASREYVGIVQTG
jgi:hypothetical protein